MESKGTPVSLVVRPEVLWPDRKKGPYRLVFHWANLSGYARLIGVDVRGFRGAHDPALGESVEAVTASLLRQLPLLQLAEEAYRDVADQFSPILGKTAAAGKTGRRRLGLDELERVAAIYRAGGTKPTAAVAEALSISPSAAAKRVATARRLGLLEPTTQGRAGGPTDTNQQQRRGRR